jgi:tetratricopeptide (TPR) repeat protein
MDESDAVTLFIERARALRADFGDSPAVHELVRRLDGLPLAIELAAARVKLLGPEQLLERIAQRLDLLKGGRDADERHATLRTTIAWSYDLLDDDERRLFARLAVFRGGCTLEAAEAVCDSNLDTLASLLDKSLVRRRTDANGDERFWMLETIREFAREHLAASGEEDALRRLQTDWLIELADRAGMRATVGVPGKWDVDLVAPEIDNVRAVLDWAAEHDPERGLALAASLEGFWLVREPTEGASRLEPLLARAPDAEPELRAHALRALGGALELCGEPDRAAPCYQHSLELFIASEEEIQTANLRYRVAGNMVQRGETAAAEPLLEESLRTFRQLGLPRGEAQVLGYLAEKPHGEGDLARAIELTLEGAAIAREIGWGWWESGQLSAAAWFERERGNLDAAEGHALRSLKLSLSLGDRRRAVLTAAKLAVIAAERLDAERAGRLWGAIESEQASRPFRQWENRREELEALVLRVDGPAFASARAEGCLLSIAEAAGLELAPAG